MRNGLTASIGVSLTTVTSAVTVAVHTPRTRPRCGVIFVDGLHFVALKDMLLGTERASLSVGTFHGLFHITLLSFPRCQSKKSVPIMRNPRRFRPDSFRTARTLGQSERPLRNAVSGFPLTKKKQEPHSHDYHEDGKNLPCRQPQ